MEEKKKRNDNEVTFSKHTTKQYAQETKEKWSYKEGIGKTMCVE